MNARELALKVLFDIQEKNAYSNIELKKQLDSSNLEQVERGFATELVYGVIKWRLQLDWIIEQLSNIKLHKISPWIINILRLGIYQLKFLDKVPQSAAVNESVKLAKKYENQGAVKFVNGLLRGYTRKKSQIKFPDEKDAVKYISVLFSHPEYLVMKWINQFGIEFTKSLCEANNVVAPMTIRVNTLNTSKDVLIDKLKSEGIEVRDGFYFKDSIILENPHNISNLNSFKEGLLQVQDESSMLVGVICDPKPGQIIADVCAAPGGKSTHIAQLMNNQGLVYSRDIHEHKIKLIEDNVQRLGINIIKTGLKDASEVDEELLDKCDRVVVDAPCSGLGIIRRKPDIRWNKQTADIQNLINIQKKILDTSSKYVKKDGYLIYSTCTINKEENIEVVNDFLGNHNNFMLTDISDSVPKRLQKESCKEGFIQIYQNVDHIDGFFVARMKRIDLTQIN